MTFLAHCDHISPATNNLQKEGYTLVARIEKTEKGFTSVGIYIWPTLTVWSSYITQCSSSKAKQ